MRAGPIIAGSILLVVGIAATVGGGIMKSMGELCIDMRCDDADDAFGLLLVGNALFLGGALSALAGIAFVVAGVVADARPRIVPVRTATSRACPHCDAATPTDARYCAACGSAIAPIARA